MFTHIRSGAEARFRLDGKVLRVRAKCNEITEERHWFGIVKRAKWTVKMEFDGRAKSFSFTLGEGIEGYDETIDFADFAECVAEDAAFAYEYDNLAEFLHCVGYPPGHTDARRAWEGCKACARKLNRVFSLRRGKFADCAERRDWQPASAASVG